MKLQMSFGENLINLRKQKGWSQDDLADNLNLSRQAISKWENDTSKPDIDNVKKISKVFSVTIDDLLNNDVVKDKAVTLNVKKQEKKEKTITIVKCMIIAVIILYIINVIFKFASLLLIVNGIQKYANLSNYHYVITTYENNELIQIKEGWFKNGIIKTVTTDNISSSNQTIQTVYINFNNMYGIIYNNENTLDINVEDYLKTHLNYDNGAELYLLFPIELRKNFWGYILNESLNTVIKNNDTIITIKLKNKIIELQKKSMLPILYYDYNIKNNKVILKTFEITLNYDGNIEIENQAD